jgi:hypothetical protein
MTSIDHELMKMDRVRESRREIDRLAGEIEAEAMHLSNEELSATMELTNRLRQLARGRLLRLVKVD